MRRHSRFGKRRTIRSADDNRVAIALFRLFIAFVLLQH
jgi:hypothetical protein